MKDWEINEAQLDDMYTVFNASSESYVLGKIMNFFLNSNVFAEWKAWEIKNSIYYAVKHDKYMLHFKKGSTPLKCIGFCTWGFLKREEIDNDFWDGNEVFARENGEVFYFPTFYCDGGVKEIYKFVTNIQKFIWNNYPNVTTCESYRSKLKGGNRMQLWKVNQKIKGYRL